MKNNDTNRVKVAMIGAGGVGWTLRLVRDILTVPELQNTIFSLTDIDEHRLQVSAQRVQQLISDAGLPAQVLSGTDRRAMLRDADYVINAVRVGGVDAWKSDVEIPLKYGVDQCIGDTLGPGGIMYGQRTAPAILDFCKDIREVAKKDVLFLNYTNPMSILTWIAIKHGGVNTLGLCHGVQHGISQIQRTFDATPEEFSATVAGVNHMTWFIKLMLRGEDVTHKLLDRIEQKMQAGDEMWNVEAVRLDILKRTGYYCTESNGFCSELLPWYRSNPDTLSKWYNPEIGGHHAGETLGGLRFNQELQEYFTHNQEAYDSADIPPFDPEDRSNEHASYIIEARETGRVYQGCFNVVNHHCISNVSDDAIVEIPCVVDRTGVHPEYVGPLPPVCASICEQMVSTQRLAVEAAVTGNVQTLKQAMMLDALTSAVLSTEQIWQMTDEMLVSLAELLPQYQHAIPECRAHLKKNPPPQEVPWPATRKKVRSYDEMMATPDDAGVREVQRVVFGTLTRNQ